VRAVEFGPELGDVGELLAAADYGGRVDVAPPAVAAHPKSGLFSAVNGPCEGLWRGGKFYRHIDNV
jgi:hypothetical protein